MIFYQTTWLMIGFSMLAAELFNPGIFFALSMSFGAFAAACACIFSNSLQVQFSIFFATSTILFLIISTFLARAGFSKTVWKKEATNVDALIGQIGVATTDCPSDAKGFAKVAGEVWSVINIDQSTISVGDKIKVLKVEGNKLYINKIEDL